MSNQDYVIATDTSANLPTPMAKEAGLEIIPFSYTMNGVTQTTEDTETFDGIAFYDAIRKGARVQTSLINTATYLERFTPLAKQGLDILFIGMSSGISGSFSAAYMAMQELHEAFPNQTFRAVDTLAASLGEGMLALEACRLKKEGLSLTECADRIETMRRSLCQVFTVDNLMHLRRTGRLSGAKAAIGTVLNIKPILKGNEFGQIVTAFQVRGRERSIQALGDKYDEFVVSPETQTVGIAHAGCPEDAATLIARLNKNKPPRSIMTVGYEPVTGSHVGPGTIALFFMADPDVRSKN